MKHVWTGVLAAAVAGAMGFQLPGAASAHAKEEIVHQFGRHSLGHHPDGELPFAGVIDVMGELYATTSLGGTYGYGAVVAVDTTTHAEKVLYSFCSQQNCPDGENPRASLVAVNGTLYGTTEDGGGVGSGTVFSVDPETGSEKVIYSFCGQQNCTDGSYPRASLIYRKGVLYGTTIEGGAYGQGAVFALDPATSTETALYSFCAQVNCPDGEDPVAGLIEVNGVLYGTASGGGGGAYGPGGTVLALAPATGKAKVLYSFCNQRNCTDGSSPESVLVQVNGTLYGTTYAGGNRNYGTVFALDPQTGAETVLYSFCSKDNCADGVEPTAGLIDTGSTLYGTTHFAGVYHEGTAFSLDLTTGKEKLLHSFGNGTDGWNPMSSLIDVDSTLYGTTEGGGKYQYGTLFALTNF